MIGTLSTQYPWLWPLAWQSTVCLAAGLAGSYLCRRRAARAHRILLLGLMAAAIIPVMSQIVRQNQWGLFVAERAVPPSEQHSLSPRDDMVIPGARMMNEARETQSTRHSLEAMPVPETARFKWTQALMPLWLAASSVLLLRLAIRFFLAWRLAKQSELIDGTTFGDTIEAAKDRLGIRTSVVVRAGGNTRSPVIWCWSRRPILLIPVGSHQDSADLDWMSIICHELAHWKQRDHANGLLAELMVCILPWQPLAWWTRRRLVALSEEACDDWVIASGQRATGYARTLLHLGLTPQGQASLVPGVVVSRRGLAGRVRRILHDGCGNPHPGLYWTVAVFALAGCISLGLAFAQTRPGTPEVQGENAAPQAPPTAPIEKGPSVNQDKILLRLVDPNGQPVHEAKAAPYVGVGTRSILGSRLEWQGGGTSDETGQVVLETENLFRGQRDKAPVYILHERRGIGAVHEVARGGPADGSPIVLRPVCRVHGALDCTGLAAIGMPLRWAHMYVDLNDTSFIEYSFQERQRAFELSLPPGAYTFNPYGSGAKTEDPGLISVSTKTELLPVVVPEGQRDLDLGTIDLRPTKIATLIGRPAPEIGPMKAWKNGPAVTLAQLRGQIVWLHFSGGYPSASRDLPKLVELHEAFGDQGLTIIAIFSCASMEELAQRWTEANARFGGVQEVPFRVAIDGGKPTFYEGTGRERPGATYGRYDITMWPTDILIDTAGNVIGQSHAFRAKETISRMLAMPQERVDYPVNEGRTQASLVAGEARTLRFPQDRSLGTLYVRDLRKEDWYEGWEKAGEAKGDVLVGAGKQGKLEVNEETAADLSPLAGLGPDDLQMLCFGWKPVTIGSLAPVAKLMGLQALNLQSTKFDPGEFRYLTGLQHLEILRLGDYKLTDTSMEYVGKLTSLRSLALWGTGISDDGLKHLQGLTNLTFLALNRCTITDEGLRYLRRMTALEGLQLSQTKISDQGLVHLRHLTCLKNLDIGYNGITDAGIKHVEGLAQLETISISMDPISDEGFASLALMKNLRAFDAYRTNVTDAGLVHLEGLQGLHHITMSGIGDEGIGHLSKVRSLNHVQILDAKVTKASVPHFQAMPSLEKLLLSGDAVDDDLLEALRVALPQCQVWDPQRSREYPMPEWRRRFEAVYRLEEGEVLKRIAPPFIPERMDYYRNEYEYQAQAIPRGPEEMTFHWDGKLKNWGMSFGRFARLDFVLNRVVGLKRYEYEGPKPLLDLELPGDWIIRDETPPELKLQALTELIAREFDRDIWFEQRTLERSTIVATGKFQFHPPVGTYENTAVHLWAEESDTDEGAGGGTADSLEEFLQMLGNRVNMPVVDRTEPGEQGRIPYRHHRSSRVGSIPDEQERARQLGILLDHLTAQTELQFEIRTQPAEIWLVIEPDAN